MRYIAFFLALLLYGCSSLKKDKITVTGTAWNAKRGAVLETGGETYTVDGLESWDTVYYREKVTVSGFVKRVDHGQQSTPERKVQEMVGIELIIVDAKWELADGQK